MVDILNVEHPNYDRDRHIITPVYLYLRKHYKFNVKTCYHEQALWNLLIYKPKLLLMSYFHGAPQNVALVELCHKLGVKIVTLTTEGNYQRENLDGYLWGWKQDKILLNDVLVLWNERSKGLVLEKYPELEDKIKVSGGTGFDRYKLLKYKSKEEFLQENGLSQYKKVIGIASWGIFYHIEDEEYFKSFRDRYLGHYTDEQIEMHRKDLNLMRKIYHDLIADNPDTLFILRFHPLVRNIDQSEFKGCTELPNVFVSNHEININYKIDDLIALSDLWLAYDSGTAIEAWLLDKPTVLLNPSGIDFIRESAYVGSTIVDSKEELERSINEFYESGKISDFENKIEERERVIEEVIQYSDGKNHQRAAKITSEYLPESRPNFWAYYRLFPYKRLLSQRIRYFLYQSWIYNQFRRSTALDYWYPKDKMEIKNYEKLYDKYISES
ncbi:MAG: hypothetical protein CL840_05925 [Crocinitomicaceae bacterium]|nr:hypothetical protein [Crocinitomicaceae bacterium]|tara:strand:+ start:121 stop:1440 length:1320 start_codon:yes stop_codon:yes gene_type:complete